VMIASRAAGKLRHWPCWCHWTAGNTRSSEASKRHSNRKCTHTNKRDADKMTNL
jgi:hypothetical protein